jgi:hypothetical protein
MNIKEDNKNNYHINKVFVYVIIKSISLIILNNLLIFLSNIDKLYQYKN